MAILIIMVISLILSTIVVLSSAYLEANDDKYYQLILDILPGLNCGACGYGNCQGLAKAVINDKNNILKCRPLKKEAKDKFLGIENE